MRTLKTFLIGTIGALVVAVTPTAQAIIISEWTTELIPMLTARKHPSGPTVTEPTMAPPKIVGPENFFMEPFVLPTTSFDVHATSTFTGFESAGTRGGSGSIFFVDSVIDTDVTLAGRGVGLTTATASGTIRTKFIIDLDQPVRISGRFGVQAYRFDQDRFAPVVGTWSGLARLDLSNFDDGTGNSGPDIELFDMPAPTQPIGFPDAYVPTDPPPFDVSVPALTRGEIIYQAQPAVALHDIDSIPASWNPAIPPRLNLEYGLKFNLFDIDLGTTPNNPIPAVIDAVPPEQPQQVLIQQVGASARLAGQHVSQFRFFPTDLWYEVPGATTFGNQFEMLSDDLFETIAGISGFEGLVRVIVDDQEVAALSEGEGVDFVATLGAGVKSFRLMPDGIGPAKPAVHLTFDNTNAHFAVVPEPGALTTTLLAVLTLLSHPRRRR